MKSIALRRFALTFVLAVAAAAPAFADGSVPSPVAQRADVYFSPKGGGLEAIVQLVDSARSSIRLAAYSFTSAPVTRALIDARRRGVDVGVLADYRFNTSQDRSGKGIAALNALALAGVRVRTIAKYQIFHDKFMVIDGLNIQTGSFNYSSSAQLKNSENVLILWNSPGIAKQYLEHWARREAESDEYRPLEIRPSSGRFGNEGGEQ
jgi:phosphatidylserine/phosphatidylglycerophosphate/cardiolipin synthase-like enzyme